MAKTAQRPATYDDLLRVPEHLVAEIVDGELFASPRPAVRHARANIALASRLYDEFDGGSGGNSGSWWIIAEPELHLGSDVLVPDVAGWRRERMPEMPDVVAIDLAPDWICEVASPSTGRLDRVRKLPAYARHGVAFAWIVDPLQKSLEVYELRNEAWTLIATHENDDVVRAKPFEAIELKLDALWI